MPGLLRVICERQSDERGGFARLWCAAAIRGQGGQGVLSQCSISTNRRAGTVRGLHFQRPPHEEEKLVLCLSGAAFDVAVDLRPDSPSHRRWHSEILSAENGVGLLIPPGFAHGFQTLAPDTDLLYFISVPHAPEFADGLRWDDPQLAIPWPLAPAAISHADLNRGRRSL